MTETAYAHRPLIQRYVRSALWLFGFAVLAFGWSHLLFHNLSRAEELWQEIVDRQTRNVTVIGADFLEYRDYYKDFPKSFDEASSETMFVEFYKRPLYGPISGSLSILLSDLGLGYPRSMYLILPAYAALATILLFQILRKARVPVIETALLTAVGTMSFAWLSIFSIPESYSLSTCAALVSILSGTLLPELSAVGARRAVARHVLVAAVASWVYPLLSGAVLLIISRVNHRRQWLTIVFPAVVFTAILTVAPYLLAGRTMIQEQADYLDKWTSLHNFVDPALIAQVGSAFLFFGILAPVADFVRASPQVQLTAALGNLTLLISVATLLGLYVTLTWFVVSRRGLKPLNGALAWFMALFVFHMYYNPREVLLYMSVPSAVLFYLIGLSLAVTDQYGSSGALLHRRVKLSALLVLLGLELIANVPAVLGR